MFLEIGDCIDVKKFEIPFGMDLRLDNFYEASKSLVQFNLDRIDVALLNDYINIVANPVALISEHFKKTVINPNLHGLFMNQYSIYEVIGANNIKNTTIKNLLPTPYILKIRVSYYK